MKTFRQFLEEASNSITRFREHGYGLKRGGREAPSELPKGMTGYGLILRKLMSKRRDVTKREYGKLQQKYNDEYFNSPQINPPIVDPLKKIKA